MNSNILNKAYDIVYARAEEKDRMYGSPVESFQKASKIASILCGKEISVKDIIRVQMALKLSRESNAHKEDNLVDLVAYASVLNDVENIPEPTNQTQIIFNDTKH
jgi:hypothetical protein